MSEKRKNPLIKDMESIGGILHRDQYRLVPFNHWKRDNYWMVIVMHEEVNDVAFMLVKGLTEKEAVAHAIHQLEEE